MTALSGIFLLLSFIFDLAELNLPFDLAVFSVIISGTPLVFNAVKKLIWNSGIKRISSALLISVAMAAATAIGDLFAAGEVAFIMALGEILEDLTTDRAKRGLKNLISLTPTHARRIKDGKEEMLAAEEICEGDIIRILPGEAIAVDGVVVSGESSVDEFIMTGESLPKDKCEGDTVFSGTVNRFGVIDIQATKVGKDSSLQKLIRLVREAEDKKAPMERLADKVASWLVPAAMLIAILTGIITKDIVRAVTVLVVFCPCSLVLATPTAIMAAIGQATKHGIVIKSGEALEKMGKINTLAFDKTGTLTYGKLEVSDVIPLDDSIDRSSLLALAASAESKSEHPVGRAIVACSAKENLSLSESEAFKITVGRGVYASVGGNAILCGNKKYFEENGIQLDKELISHLDSLNKEGKAIVIVAKNENPIGIIALSDTLRPEAEAVIKRLSDMKLNTVLLTGDNRNAADYFAKKLGINEVKSELLPEEKLEFIRKTESGKSLVCMIGDGVNDAPSLKTASVGIAMGGVGSDIAVESADIALVSDDLSKIPYLNRLAKATVKTIKFGITLSMCINFLAVTLSVLGLLGPTLGALVHNAGSCLVVLIAALLYDRKFN